MSGFFDPVGAPDISDAPKRSSGDKRAAALREEYGTSPSSTSSGAGSSGGTSSGGTSSGGGPSGGGSSSGGSSRDIASRPPPPAAPVTAPPMREQPTYWPLGETWRDGGYTDAVPRLGVGIGRSLAGGPPVKIGSPDQVLVVTGLVLAELMATDAIVTALGIKGRLARAVGYIAVGLTVAGAIGYATYKGR